MSGRRNERRRDWVFVSDAAESALRYVLSEGDKAGALAILAEIHAGHDFSPVLKDGRGGVTARELAVIRDCQRLRAERADRDTDAVNVEADAPQESGAATHADLPATSSLSDPSPSPPETPQAAPQIAAAVDEAVSAIAKPEQLSDEQLKSMTVEEYHRHFRDTAQKLPSAVHGAVVRWMQKNRDAAGTTTVYDALKWVRE